jgi:hypothetical protein
MTPGLTPLAALKAELSLLTPVVKFLGIALEDG